MAKMRLKIFTYLIAAIVSLAATAEGDGPKIQLLPDVYGISEDSQSDYPLADIFQGCPRQDCIPSIDTPIFALAADAYWMEDNDLVMGISINGDTRAYPTIILQRHEIVNDNVGGQAVAVTYCPLCGSGVVFSRLVDGKELDFGVSGLLHGSDLIMYDRQSNSLWQQITGQSFAGALRGKSLAFLDLSLTEWKNWIRAHPDTRVLSTADNEQADTYAKYRASDKIVFGGKRNNRLKPKRIIYGAELDGVAVAFDAKSLAESGKVITRVGALDVRATLQADGKVSIRDLNSDRLWQAHRMFWFAWFTFHPDTTIAN